MNKREVQRTLKRAQKLVANGWCQNWGMKKIDNKLCYCAWGALDAAGHTTTHTIVDDACEVLVSCVPSNFPRSIIDYNDAPNRTQAQVVALFDRAIAKVS